MASAHQLFLLADHIKLSVLEQQRAQSLNLPSNTQDSQISRSLNSLREGIDSLKGKLTGDPTEDDGLEADIETLEEQFQALSKQFSSSSSTIKDGEGRDLLTKPNDQALARDFEAATKRPTAAQQSTSKSVRFRDNVADEELERNRDELFENYTDNPQEPETDHLDNQQLHQYHSQVLRDQDDQLEVLGQSIGRTRELSMQIGSELDSHVALLDDIEAGVDRHESNFQRAQRRLKKVGKDARENWSMTTIVVLIIILVLLIVILK